MKWKSLPPFTRKLECLCQNKFQFSECQSIPQFHFSSFSQGIISDMGLPGVWLNFHSNQTVFRAKEVESNQENWVELNWNIWVKFGMGIQIGNNNGEHHKEVGLQWWQSHWINDTSMIGILIQWRLLHQHDGGRIDESVYVDVE